MNDEIAPPLLSLVSPACNEAANLRPLYQRICLMAAEADITWEWIVVDDCSSDNTFQILQEICQQDGRVRGVRLSRNFGSHAALHCGIEQAWGQCCVVLAADQQDPPEVVPRLLEPWRGGARVVWAVREHREAEHWLNLLMSRLYYWIMRHWVGLKELPAAGADFWLMDRLVCESLLLFPEKNVNVIALLCWLGFRQEQIVYTKEARVHGRSKWTLARKLKLAMDTITAFSHLPIRLTHYSGLLLALSGFIYSIYLIFNAFYGNPVEGWTSLIVVVLILGGIQMVMIGVLGEYSWRALDESRRRPRYVIEEVVGNTVDRIKNKPFKLDT